MIGRWAALGRELRTPIKFLDALFRRFGWHHMPTLAAGLAFYFLLAFFPFLLFLVAIVTIVPGVEGLTDWLLQTAATFLPPSAWTLAEGVIRGLLGQPRSGLVSLGVVLALWSASSGFTSLMDCLNVAFGVTERRAWWKTRLEALVAHDRAVGVRDRGVRADAPVGAARGARRELPRALPAASRRSSSTGRCR
jgi:uncharacterized BrkB/YihY/UPF0761 family membrane protein